MKQKTKVSLITGVITLLIVLIFASCFMDEYRIETDRLDFCHSKGYDSYKDVSGFLEFSKYKCYKEVSVDTGYEYEYSGYVD